MGETPQVTSGRDATPPAPAGQPESAFRIFLQELRRRRVYQVAAAYAVAGSLVVQLAPTLLDAFGLPAATRFVVLLAVAGFPVALAFAWLFQLATSVRRESGPAVPGAARAAHLARLALVAVVVVAGLTAATVLWRMPRNAPISSAGLLRAGAPGAADSRVAVLYLDDLSPDGGGASLAVGLTENLIDGLRAAAPDLTIISANGVRPYRGSRLPPDSIARALGVATLVTGSVTRAGGRVRVAVRLVSGATGELIARTTVEQPDGEFFALLDDVGRETSLFLRRHLGRTIALQQSRAGTSSQRAWELVQRAQQTKYGANALVSNGELAAGRAQQAVADSLFAAAERADEHWTFPTVQRGWLALRVAVDGSRRLPAESTAASVEHAVAFADRALALAPGDAGALELRGSARRYLWTMARPRSPVAAAALLAAAERDLTTAVDRDPQRAAAWSGLSAIRMHAGDLAGAETAARTAFEVDAYAGDSGENLWRAFEAAFQLGHDEDAGRWCDELARRKRGETIGVVCALRLAAWGTRPPDVSAAWARVRQIGGSAPVGEAANVPLAQIAMAAVLARAGLSDSARAVLERALAARAAPPAPALLLPEARVRVLLHEDERAAGLVRRYLAAYPDQADAIARDRCLRPLESRAGPRKQAR